MSGMIDETAPLHEQLGRALLLAVSKAYGRAVAAGDEEWQAKCVASMQEVNEMLNRWEQT